MDYVRYVSCNVVTDEQNAPLFCSYADHDGLEAEYSISHTQAISAYESPVSIDA